MSRFPDLLDAQRCALFEIVKIFRKHHVEGRAAIVLPPQVGDTRVMLLVRRAPPEFLDTDFDTLRVLDEAGHIAFTETSRSFPDGSDLVFHTLILKKLASDYYDWCHASPWYKPLAERWFSLAPDTRSAIVGGVAGVVTTSVLAAFGVLIRGCLSG